MIPLGEWLSGGRGNGPVSSELPAALWSAVMDQSTEERDSGKSQARLDEAYERGRAEAFAEMAARGEAALAEQQKLMEAREREIVVEWSARCSSAVSASIKDAFADLRHRLETALSDALSPFLDGMAHAKALQQVMRLLAAEMTGAPDPVLEIRAPAAMHEHLSLLLEQQGFGVTLTESDKIEAVSHSGTAKFETMAARWIELMRGGET